MRRARESQKGKLTYPFGFINRDSGPSGSSNNSDDGAEAGEAGEGGKSAANQPREEKEDGFNFDKFIEEEEPELTTSDSVVHDILLGSPVRHIGVFPGGSDAPPADLRLPQLDDFKELEQTNKEYINLIKKLTISRDQTEASNFQKERLLAIEDETFEQRQAQQPALAPPHALQDYQMQLMLLEQQNKKRLLMARQEQDNDSYPPAGFPPASPSMPAGPAQASHVSPFYPPGSNTTQLQDIGMPMSWNLPQLPIRSGPSAGQLPRSTSAQQTADAYKDAQGLASMNAKAKKDVQLGDVGLVNQLLSRIEALEAENKRLVNPMGQPNRPSRFQVFHVLARSETVCLQEPSWTFNKHGNLEMKEELPLVDLETHLRRNDDLAFLVYKSYSTPWISKTDLAEVLETGVMPSPEPSHESITIRSEELRVAFEMFLSLAYPNDEERSYYLGAPIQAPYLFWYHCRSNRQALSQLQPKHQQQMKLLIDWIETHYGPKYEQFDEMISRRRISHAFVEYLFRTGDVVVATDRGKTRAYRLHTMPALERVALGRDHNSQTFDMSRRKSKDTQKSDPREPWRWKVPCWSIRYDGNFYRQSTKIELSFNADGHNDEIDISGLNVIPLSLAGEEVQQQLLQRGCTFWSCRIKKLVSYKGDEDGTFHTDGERYMVDNESYKKLHLDTHKRNVDYGFSDDKRDIVPIFKDEMADDEPPSAPSIYLFPPTITGFSLRRKRWTDLVVDNIIPVSWNKQAFNRLVADDKTKELVQALVADRIAGERNTDLIQGKGNGLIILLHGGPGTGKTFTAESVAEMAEKPLYPVTCGDIGTEPEQVEKYLESVLYLGDIWDCVVLLDEADVFLEERGIADLARNALVSVFLRVLEYYDGILILTSNRVGTFDEAFKSRISLALHYPDLTKSQRCRIWKNFLNRLKELKEPNIDFDDIELNITALAEDALNGRQIRNAITIGRQLAKFQNKDLSYAHLKHVVEVASQFETYVKKTKEDMSDEQIARLSGRRW